MQYLNTQESNDEFYLKNKEDFKVETLQIRHEHALLLYWLEK